MPFVTAAASHRPTNKKSKQKKTELKGCSNLLNFAFLYKVFWLHLLYTKGGKRIPRVPVP